MRKITKESLVDGLVIHPYESNPQYFSRINFYKMSPDKKLLSYYWEAPEGNVSITFDQFDELIIILDGVLEVQSASSKITLEALDCLSISRDDGAITFNILEEVKAFGYVYPTDENEYQNIVNLMNQSI